MTGSKEASERRCGPIHCHIGSVLRSMHGRLSAKLGRLGDILHRRMHGRCLPGQLRVRSRLGRHELGVLLAERV